MGAAVIAAVVNLALVDPADGIGSIVTAAILVGIAGASFDIVIDAYRIEILEPRPVSYQHLDVYKRQALTGVPSTVIPASEGRMVAGVSSVVPFRACLLYTSRCV